MQPPFDIIAEKRIKNGTQGHAYNHAHNAAKPCAYHSRNKQPQLRQADGFADNSRIENIAFDTLQYKEKDNENNNFSGCDITINMQPITALVMEPIYGTTARHATSAEITKA